MHILRPLGAVLLSTLVGLGVSLGAPTAAAESSASSQISDVDVVIISGRKVKTQASVDGITIDIFGQDGRDIDTRGMSGSVHLETGKNSYDFPLIRQSDGKLIARADLSRAVDYDLNLTVNIDFVGIESIVYRTTLKISDLLSDTFLMKLQGQCPISGKALNPEENPPKLTFDGRPLFVCCNGCAGTVNQNPQKYLDLVYNAPPQESRPGVYVATLADAEAIAKQYRCPVLEERLDLIGVPLKIQINGKTVFLSCAGCAKFVQAEPQKYMAKLAQEGVSPPTWR